MRNPGALDKINKRKKIRKVRKMVRFFRGNQTGDGYRA